MKTFVNLPKLQKGDKVAILSPSFAAPGVWPDIYELGLNRLRNTFGLEPIEFPSTKKVGSSEKERADDLIAAFEDKKIKGISSTLGGDDQVTYIKNLPSEPFVNNPKPFFGYSDNTHFTNFLWLNGIPSYYGGSLFVQFAEQGKINPYTLDYLNKALFESGEIELKASNVYSDQGLDWSNNDNITKQRPYEPNSGWMWNGGAGTTEGISWGGCLESIDELLRHNIVLPSLKDFEDCVLITETSEEIPSAEYVSRVYRALGERGILERIKAVLVGRPKAWNFNNQKTTPQKKEYSQEQSESTIKIIRQYNSTIPIIQNMDFGHTEPQIPFPYGKKVTIDSNIKKIKVIF